MAKIPLQNENSQFITSHLKSNPCGNMQTFKTFKTFLGFRIATVLSSELLYAIWIVRNEVVFDHKRKSTIDIERLFRHRVRWRIKTDFVRLNRQAFIDLWCKAYVLVTWAVLAGGQGGSCPPVSWPCPPTAPQFLSMHSSSALLFSGLSFAREEK